MSLQGYWADQKSSAFGDLPDDLVAVLPVGAIEQHGPHLPLSVDRDLVDATVERALPLLGADQSVLILPTLTITKSGEHDRHAGTLSLSAETMLAMVRDIGASVAMAGVTRLVLLNGHGGNSAVLDIAARDLRIAHDLIVVTCFWSAFAELNGMIDKDDYAFDLHAGEGETSAMLAARPDLVDMQLAQNFVPAMRNWAMTSHFVGLTGQAARPAWIVDDLHPEGACGNALAATREKGEQFLDSAARNFALFLREFARFDHRAS